MENTRRKKTRSIFVAYLVPMLSVILFQTLLFVAAIFMSGTFNEIRHVSSSLLSESVSNRRDLFQKSFLDNWSNLSLSVDQIETIAADVLTANNASYDDLFADDNEELSTKVINEISDELFLILRQNSVSGSFLILGDLSETAKMGLYYRDTMPNDTLTDYSDIIYEIAPLNFNNPFKILGSNRKQRSFFNDPEANQSKSFFTNPATYKTGWFSDVFKFQGEDILTYSVPLFTPSKEVFGVLGVELSVKYLKTILPYNELYMTEDGQYVGTYFLGKIDDLNNINFDTMVSNSLFPSTLKGINDYAIYETNLNNTYELTFSGNRLIISIQELDLYQRNSAFENEKWYIIGGVPTANLFAKSNDLTSIIIIVIAVSFLIGIIIVGLSSYFFSKPIMDLTDEIISSKNVRTFKFKQTNITEIDDLTGSIEKLNERILESDTKLSNILSLVDLQVVAFEYDINENYIFLSSDLSRVIHFDVSNITTASDLKRLLETFEDNKLEENGTVITYKYLGEDENPHWIDLRLINDTVNQKSGLLVDVTAQYLEKETLIFERNIDSLTGIYNRRGFTDKIDELFKNKLSIKQGAFLMMDLDNLKYINDAYGHDYGDEYLRITGQNIKESCGKIKNCIYGRRSGDEFYIFLYGFLEFSKISECITEILTNLSKETLDVPDGNKQKIRVSSGIALFPQDSLDHKELMLFADYAMYEAKTSSKGSVKYFDRESYDKNAYIIQNKEALNTLIEKELIDHHFQPIVDLKDGEVFAYEALMRSNIDSFKSPAEIISVAQSQYKLNQIEKLTFFKSLEKYKQNINLFKDKKLFINSFANQIMSQIDIELFLTENKEYMKNIVVELIEYEKSVTTIFNMKREAVTRFGGQIALDDYGTGYSSESALLEANPNYVKIDMSLIRNIHQDPDRASIVLNIVLYAQNRGIKTIAEGIETLEELEAVIKLGCNYAQGYLFGKPAPLPENVSNEMKDKISSIYKKHYNL